MPVELIDGLKSQNNGNDLIFILFHEICEIYLLLLIFHYKVFEIDIVLEIRMKYCL